MFFKKSLLSITAVLSLCSTLVLAHPTKRAVAFFPPVDGGGSQLDSAAPPLGEPLNVRIPHLSSLFEY